MSDKMISPRDAYGAALKRLGAEHPEIVALDADLSESTRSSKFRDVYPERFFNAGIAEQNMIGMAAGLAASGKVAFASTFAVFATGRTYDQIRQLVARSKLNVKIVGSHGGITVGEDGPSHQATEDLALMRALPNMRVFVPGDAVETERMVETALELDGPVYIRTSRVKFPVLFDENYRFKEGKGVIVREGGDITIIACGLMVSESMKAAAELEKDGISARVVNMGSIKPLDRELIVRCAKETGKILTIEEHSIFGGLGSAVAEVVAEEHPVHVQRMGLKDEFGVTGDSDALLCHFCLTAEHIRENIRRWLKKVED